MNCLIDKKVNKTSAQDCKQTPIDLAKTLINMVPIKNEHTIYEPFRGDGNFYNQFPYVNRKLWSEIKENKDFFNYDGENIDWVITNPPWSKITRILDKLVKICDVGFAGHGLQGILLLGVNIDLNALRESAQTGTYHTENLSQVPNDR